MLFLNKEHTRLNLRQIWIGFFLVLLLCLLSMIFIDRAVLLLVHDQLPREWYIFFRKVSRLGKGDIWGGGSLLAALSGYALHRFGKNSTFRKKWLSVCRKASFVFVSLLASGVLLNVVKTMIGRMRPRFFLAESLYGFKPFNFDFGMNCFPSGHSQTIWAAMLSLSLLFPRFRILFFLFATLVASSRVFVSAHFVSDVLMGSYLGIAVTFYFYAWFVRKGYLPEDEMARPLPTPKNRHFS